MTLVACSPFIYPEPGATLSGHTSNTGHASITLDGASEYAAFIFHAPATGTIVGACVRGGTVTTGTTGGSEIAVTIEGVSATTGGPDGTPKSGGSGTLAIVATTDNNKMFTDGFGSGATAFSGVSVTEGDLLALRIKNPASNVPSFTILGYRNLIPYNTAAYEFPYWGSNTSGSWAATGSAIFGGIEYGTGGYLQLGETISPYLAYTEYTYANNTAQKEYGAKITVPFKCRVTGAVVITTGGGDFDCLAYDSGNTAITGASVSMDKDIHFNQSAGDSAAAWRVKFPTPFELTAGDYCYIAIKPTSTTTLVLGGLSVESSGFLTGCIGGGNVILVNRATQGSGAWTETNTVEPRIFLIIDKLDDASGGGSGSHIQSRVQVGM